ncbi:3-oxoadipyl-CoA thiolase [Rhodopseudomonas palustris]|uniref:3-oxoadipyl-CoA thiolase n=1 Tax=Rhodopseudomonas palustris TaxID=1076 RepID=UPI000E5C05FF|nr:3-oxoadipyl-CoA thiolase [Rhodopseudomonas palustris]QLH69720.1 3-oxoadipyl-CoA thiolase [Rhodopseudomonas palustris]RIA03029.1 3-oxoadipyl-CoA thiolase [Rhodopseudomonas palustris]
MADVFVCDAVRTPIGRYGGSLAKVRTDDLAAVPIKALMAKHPDMDWSAVDEVFFGCANQAGEDNRNVARMAALLAGLPDSVPGQTLNRLCASGLDAVGAAGRAIRGGEIDLAIAGGVESMTRAPFVQGKATEAFARSADIFDTTIGWRFINPLMKQQYGVDSMPETGENVAEEFQISRADQDAFAIRSQQRAGAAIAAGYFAEEIAPVTYAGGKAGPITVDKDEHPRPETTLEGLAKLKPIVRNPGTVTAGNASGVNDGAAALLIASEAAVKKYGLTPRAKILGLASAAVPPRIMGIGPVPATRKLMERLGLKISDFDLIELNEAFASQGLACLRQLGVKDDADFVNPHGGAIALGHPLGMSGARLALTAVHGLEKRGGKLALATMCVGVGQGVAMAIEKLN